MALIEIELRKSAWHDKSFFTQDKILKTKNIKFVRKESYTKDYDTYAYCEIVVYYYEVKNISLSDFIKIPVEKIIEEYLGCVKIEKECVNHKKGNNSTTEHVDWYFYLQVEGKIYRFTKKEYAIRFIKTVKESIRVTGEGYTRYFLNHEGYDTVEILTDYCLITLRASYSILDSTVFLEFSSPVKGCEDMSFQDFIQKKPIENVPDIKDEIERSIYGRLYRILEERIYKSIDFPRYLYSFEVKEKLEKEKEYLLRALPGKEIDSFLSRGIYEKSIYKKVRNDSKSKYDIVAELYVTGLASIAKKEIAYTLEVTIPTKIIKDLTKLCECNKVKFEFPSKDKVIIYTDCQSNNRQNQMHLVECIKMLL